MSRQILLVEDVEPHATLIHQAFENGDLPAVLTHAQTLREAKRLLMEQDWDLVLVDLRLPDGMGTELVQNDILISPPIIILTEHSDQAVAVGARGSGADYVVKSPEALADMPHIAENALRQWAQVMERIEAEEMLRESESRYRMLAENSPDIIVRFDREVHYLYCNLAIQKATGRPIYSFIHKRQRELGFDDEFSRFIEESVERTFRTERPLETNFEACLGDRRRCFNWRFIPEIGPDRSVETVLCIARDLTEHQETKAKLERSEERYRTLFETIQDGFALCELLAKDGEAKDYRFLEINPAYETMMEMPASTCVGELASKVIPAWNSWLNEYERVVSSGQPSRFQHCCNRTRKHFEVLVFRPAEGCFAILMEDVTEKIQLQDRLRQSEKMEAIGQLAGGVAHDFHNQLACILGFADLLRTRLADDRELQRYAEMVVNASKRSAELTKQLLAFARKGQYRAVEVDVNELVTEIVRLLEHSLDKKTRIERELQQAKALVKGDPNQLLNAMLNIAINGDAAMPQGGLLRFTTQTVELDDEQCRLQGEELKAGTYLEVAISDTGTGMPADVQKRIFEPFFTTKPAGEGTGMGLAAVYGTVKNHRGAIQVQSKEDEGSVFRIYLPILESFVPETAAEETEGTIQFKGEGCVLLVDDDEMVRNMAETLLAELGYRIISAADGIEALDCYKEHAQEIDLVLLDMSMPGRNGRDTYLKMREIKPDVKVLLSSGYGLAQDVQKAIDEGVLGFIHKPFEVAELMQTLSGIFDKV